MRWFVGGCALVLATLTVPTAQAPAPPARPLTPVDHAARAINEGRYDEVDAILKNESDPRVPGLRAQALVARGRYADAEALLKAPAAAAPTGDAALHLGLLQMLVGRRPDAQRVLRRVADGGAPRTPAEYARMAMASRALGEYKDANDLYRSATRLAPDDPVINTAWGELFLEKYDRPEALKSFQAALKVDPSYVPARLGLAAVAAAGNPPAAKEAIEQALKVNPNSVTAQLLLAELALDDRRRDEARDGDRQGPQGQPQEPRRAGAPRRPWTSWRANRRSSKPTRRKCWPSTRATAKYSALPATTRPATTCSTRRW